MYFQTHERPKLVRRSAKFYWLCLVLALPLSQGVDKRPSKARKLKAR
jgi:hypothetical protein